MKTFKKIKKMKQGQYQHRNRCRYRTHSRLVPVLSTYRYLISVILLFISITGNTKLNNFAEMEVDGSSAPNPGDATTAATAGTSADARPEGGAATCGSGSGTDTINLGSTYKQCSAARKASSTMTVTEFKNGSITTASAIAPDIGSLAWNGDPSVLKTFHGGRATKSGRTVNECISFSFDPRNLTCVGCETPHSIFNPLKPPVIILADQNFVPFLSGGQENCIAVARAENPTLNELGDIAVEIFEKTPIPPGSTMIFGSGSHLFKVGPSQYAQDWIHLSNRCSQKWPDLNFCPLIPIVRSDCPGSMARDINILAAWLERVYASSTNGLLDTWKSLIQHTESQCEGTVTAEVCKIPLPTSTSVGSVQTHCFVFHSPCPDTLKGCDRKATEGLIRILIDNLNRDFDTNLNPDIIVAKSWAGELKTSAEQILDTAAETEKHIVLIGSSNIRRLAPFIKSAGFSVTDLSQPSWLATPDNVEFLATKLNTLGLPPDTAIILELFGNSTFRFRQFDGTMALPYKAGNIYHMGGDIGVCEDDAFKKLCGSISGILEACKDSIKILVPPLPRYLYTPCCGNKNHSTNMGADEYELNMLQSITHFRPVLKDTMLNMGLEKFFVIDGVGALLGVLPGENRGSPVEIIRDLKRYCAPDGVHFTDAGYSNLGKTIIAAVRGVASGTLTKSCAAASSISAKHHGTYFWRGFTSPIGHSCLRTTPAAFIPKTPANQDFGPSHSRPPRPRGRPPYGHHGHMRPPKYGGHHPYWRK
jgi:hypothetical protein